MIRIEFPNGMFVHQHTCDWGEYAETVCVMSVASWVYYSYDDKSIVIRNLQVSKEHRFKGIGLLIMKAFIEQCSSLGVSISLWVDRKDESLIGWYERQGFVRGELYGECNIWMRYK